MKPNTKEPKMIIEKNIPMPTFSRKHEAIWADMEAKDSVYFEADKYSEACSFHASASAWAKRHNPSVKFARRKTEDGGVRIWRTE